MRHGLRVALVLAGLALPALGAIVAGDAHASVAYESRYTFDQTYGSVLRLIRVDLGLKITEKDPELGYVLFEYTSPESGKRVSSGSVEVVRGKEGVHVSVQLPQMPSYHEQMIVDALAKKLTQEHGEAPKKSRPGPAPAPGDDAGAADAGAD